MSDPGLTQDQQNINQRNLILLEQQAKSPLGLVPFLGAGISLSYGYPSWGKLLLSAVPEVEQEQAKAMLKDGKYEEVAEGILNDLGEDGFQHFVVASAGDHLLKNVDFNKGTVSFLPQIAKGPVVTTNFDPVVEHAFESLGKPFEAVISGPRPDLMVDALHRNRHVLMKIHGDWQDRVGRTFAKSDYDHNYGTASLNKKRELLEAAERLLFSSRSLLFIGCSLTLDRTVEVLKRVHDQIAGIRHFAIMAVPDPNKKGGESFESVRDRLRMCGILPLWYKVDGGSTHEAEIIRLLSQILERLAVETLPGAKRLSFAVHQLPFSNPEPSLPSEKYGSHIDRVVSLLEMGQLTFFLGAAIHAPTKLLAAEFYENLARAFECSPLDQEPSAVAQFIADRYGRESLYTEIWKQFSDADYVPRDTHRFIANWKNYETRYGEKIPFPLIFTTNYDHLLEHCLEQAELPYHLFSYQADGPFEGLFFHRNEIGDLRIIRNPGCFHNLTDAFVVVKLSGGFDLRRQIPESFSTTKLDYWSLAAKMPHVLPAILQKRLQKNPLLFLGHSLAYADVESLIRFAHRDWNGPRSWAVVLKEEDHDYWEQCGVELLNERVGEYVSLLENRIRKKT